MKRKITDILMTILLLAALVGVGVSVYKVYTIFTEYKAGVDEYNHISDMVVEVRETTEEEKEAEEELEKEELEKEELKGWKAPVKVDFKTLQSLNDDVVGWIYSEAIPEISYPVVQGEDNDYYLHRTYLREENFAGSVFVDFRNSQDMKDSHTIIYGHNMKNGSMFGRLKDYQSQETYEQSGYFWILTPLGDFKYEIVSVHIADISDDTYKLITEPGTEIVEYADEMKARSEYPCGDTSFSETDRMVTLSTCTDNSSTRLVVQGVRVYPSGSSISN